MRTSAARAPGAAPAREVREAVESEGLRYVTDAAPGYRRVRRGAGFAYVDAAGRKVGAASELERIRNLAIPPAYRDVWICALPNGHLQATGRDARGRKQYRYHPRWRAVRDAAKFDRMLAFGPALARIRRQVAADLARAGMPREKVLATVVRLLDQTLIRVGNEEYARENGSYGLTTLRNRHVDVEGDRLSFEFRGKSGVKHRVTVEDPRVARVVRRCLEIPGQELFQYLESDGTRRSIDSADVNEYLRDAAGGPFTAKDFRTWHATGLALALIAGRLATGATRMKKKDVLDVVKDVADRLGNTPAVCRKSYVHPELIERALAGTLELVAEGKKSERRKNEGEALLVRLLEDWSAPIGDTLGRSIQRMREERKLRAEPHRTSIPS